MAGGRGLRRGVFPLMSSRIWLSKVQIKQKCECRTENGQQGESEALQTTFRDRMTPLPHPLLDSRFLKATSRWCASGTTLKKSQYFESRFSSFDFDFDQRL